MISRTLVGRIGSCLTKTRGYQIGIFKGFSETSSYENIKVNHWSQLNTFHYAEVFNAIAFSSNSERMSEVIHIAAPMMTDQMLAMGLRMMESQEFQLGPAFYSKLVPFIKIYTKLFDRNHTQAFAETMVSMGNLGVKDDEYWDICRQKLVEEGYHRYIPLRNMGHLIKALANVGRADAELLMILGSQVIKHQLELEPENINAAIAGIESAGLGGADIFRKALEEGAHEGYAPLPLQLH